MAVPAATVDVDAALARVSARALNLGRVRRRGLDALGGPGGWGWRKPVMVAGLTGALVAALALTPLAQSIAQIFQPTQVTTLSVAQGDMSSLDGVSRWGRVSWTTQPELRQVDTAATAAQVSGLPELKVDQSKLPGGLAGAPVSFAAVPQSTGTVVFNGQAPAKLRGSTLTADVGPAEAEVFGDLAKARAAGADGAAPTDQQARDALSKTGPLLGVVEMRAPRVSSTGASVRDIKDALLAQPGLSPALRAEIEALDNPTGNLPIPIPADRTTSRQVTVRGVPGTAIGDNTGLGAGVVWIRGGVVYAVGGTVSEDQALAVASSL
jgi:hypothetical protein